MWSPVTTQLMSSDLTQKATPLFSTVWSFSVPQFPGTQFSFGLSKFLNSGHWKLIFEWASWKEHDKWNILFISKLNCVKSFGRSQCRTCSLQCSTCQVCGVRGAKLKPARGISIHTNICWGIRLRVIFRSLPGDEGNLHLVVVANGRVTADALTCSRKGINQVTNPVCNNYISKAPWEKWPLHLQQDRIWHWLQLLHFRKRLCVLELTFFSLSAIPMGLLPVCPQIQLSCAAASSDWYLRRNTFISLYYSSENHIMF